MAQRTDIHAPASASFDPEAYVLLGVFDTDPEAGEGRVHAATVARAKAQGHVFAAHVGQRHVCGHCGHALRYVALMLQQTAGEMIYVGEECLANRFEALTKDEFQQLRKAASLNRERVKLADKREAFLAATPELAPVLAAVAAQTVENGFILDVVSKLGTYGELSARQVEAVVRSFNRDVERQAAREAQEAEKAAAVASGEIALAPSGKTVVTGEVLSMRFVENPHGPGGSLKGRVRDDKGFTVWVTMPARIADDVEVGSRVRLTATLTPSEDPTHAWGARPSQPALLSA